MNAKKLKWCEDERTTLADVVPLYSPLSAQIESSSACNFKCNYCFRQIYEERYRNNSFLNFNVFKKFIEDCKGFEKPLKSIVFASGGEPTLNPNLPEMIEYAKRNKVVGTVKIITNGSMLEPKYNMKLINSGLDVLRISIQGLTTEEYVDICGFKMDMNKFLDNIRHFYINRNQCKVFIKILDSIIKGREEQFYEMFNSICDEIAIEHTIELHKEKTNISTGALNIIGESVENETIVCPIPFYSVNLAANANVNICNVMNPNDNLIGNIKADNITDIWKSKKLNEFRMMQLKGERFNNFSCSNCISPTLCLQSLDNIDKKREELLAIYES